MKKLFLAFLTIASFQAQASDWIKKESPLETIDFENPYEVDIAFDIYSDCKEKTEGAIGFEENAEDCLKKHFTKKDAELLIMLDQYGE